MTVAAVIRAGFRLEAAPPHLRGVYILLNGHVIAWASTWPRAIAHLLLVSALDPACYPDLRIS